MSRKKCKEAKLPGYEGPNFPSNIEGLNTAFNKFEINSKMPNIGVLREVGRGIRIHERLEFLHGFDFIAAEHSRTKDGYRWVILVFWYYATGELKGKALVAFPSLEDKTTRGGVWLDRSVSVFTQGSIPDTLIVHILTNEFKRLQYIMEARKLL